MKQHIFYVLLLMSIFGFAQKIAEPRQFSKAKLSEIKLVSELSSDLPQDMRNASVEMAYKVQGSIKTFKFIGDTLGSTIIAAFKAVDNRSKVYFDLQTPGPVPKIYTFAILVAD
ncbi:MAG: hypothetical protein PSX36_02785 [bacterium]|nr:hypothetical protein [bacterium]